MQRIGLIAGLLACAAGSAVFAGLMWDWVLDFDPGFEFRHQPVPTGLASSGGVTILLVDGLRLDASRRMPALNALRASGADIEAVVGTPSFSRPGRATVAVGAPPAIHGVTTNRQKRAVSLDNIIRAVGAGGGSCRVAGSKIWPGLFGKDIERCGAYKEGESKEGPGAFLRQVGEVRSSQEAGIAFVLERPATLRIADIVSTDFAAHEYGGVSPQYLAEVQRTDAIIADLVKRLDLTRETLVVTADHGHRDQGGHGGEEPEVLAIPIVMAGAGVKPGVKEKGLQADIAPTVAALLGTPIPTATAGSVLVSVLELDEARRDFLREASAQQRSAFEAAVGQKLGVRADPQGKTDWESLIRTERSERGERRVAFVILILILPPALTLSAVHLSRASRAGLLSGAVVAAACLFGPLGARVPRMSFSAINYDEMLWPFFRTVMTLSALTTLASSLASIAVGRLATRSTSKAPAPDNIGAIGLTLSAFTITLLGVWWWRFDLLSPFTLPSPDRLVQAFSLALATLSASLTSLVLMAASAALQAASRGVRPQPEVLTP